MAHIPLKNVPEILYILHFSVNATPLPCTKNFKSYELVYISCDGHKNRQMEKKGVEVEAPPKN